MSKPQVGLSQPVNLVPGVNTCKLTRNKIIQLSKQLLSTQLIFTGMASTVTTNAVAGAIMNPAEASGNPVESKWFFFFFF